MAKLLESSLRESLHNQITWTESKTCLSLYQFDVLRTLFYFCLSLVKIKSAIKLFSQLFELYLVMSHYVFLNRISSGLTEKELMNKSLLKFLVSLWFKSFCFWNNVLGLDNQIYKLGCSRNSLTFMKIK